MFLSGTLGPMRLTALECKSLQALLKDTETYYKEPTPQKSEFL